MHQDIVKFLYSAGENDMAFRVNRLSSCNTYHHEEMQRLLKENKKLMGVIIKIKRSLSVLNPSPQETREGEDE